MKFPVLILSLTLVVPAIGVEFSLPANDVTWTTSGPNSIMWNYTAGTPTFANIQLLHDNKETFQPIPNLLTTDGIIASGIDITSGMMFLTPSCIPGSPSLPTGSGYSLRMFSEQANGTRATLGTSNGTFNIVTANATECLGLGHGTFGSSSSVSTEPTSVATASANLSSSFPKSRAGAIAGGVVGGIVACLLAAGATMMYTRHRRNTRKRMTQRFVIKKGLIRKPLDSKDVELYDRS